MIVEELIEILKEYNPNATLTVGDNFYNGLSISYGGGGEGETKKTCKFVCFDIENENKNQENKI